MHLQLGNTVFLIRSTNCQENLSKKAIQPQAHADRKCVELVGATEYYRLQRTKACLDVSVQKYVELDQEDAISHCLQQYICKVSPHWLCRTKRSAGALFQT